MTVGLVLGAGGSLGWAFHLGVLEGVRQALGHEPADAQRIVGTSAGGAIAASLLAGATTDEVLAAITAPMSEEEMAEMRQARDGLFRRPLRTLRPVAPSLIRRIGPGRGLTALAGLLPAGVFPTAPLRRFPVDRLAAWPPQLWLPSVRLEDGEVVVFGRDRTDVAVADAIEATAAVPGMFRPKQIGDHRYLDGAVVSATHADLLAGEGHERVLISSPMTRPGGGPIRRQARRRLEAELAALHAAGTSTVVVCPDERLMAVAEGYPRRAPERGPDIVAAAAQQTATALARGGAMA